MPNLNHYNNIGESLIVISLITNIPFVEISQIFMTPAKANSIADRPNQYFWLTRDVNILADNYF